MARRPGAAEGHRLVIGAAVLLASAQTALARPPCPGLDGSGFESRLRDWLSRSTIAAGPALIRDPLSGNWRMRLGLVVTSLGGWHAKLVAPGWIVSASCRASCSLVVDHGAGYVARYGGLAHARFRAGACASINLPLKRRSDGKGQLTLDLFRNGLPMDPRALARKRVDEP